MRQGSVVRWFLAVGLAAFACGGGGGGPTGPGNGGGCPTTIGPAGGTACLGTQFSAAFPAGALSQETPITISATGIPGDVANGVGQAYRLGPAGTALAAPVRVSLLVPLSALGGRSINEVTLVRSTTVNGLAPAAVELTGITRSPDGTVSGTTSSFGVFAAAFMNTAPNANGGSDQTVPTGSTVNLAGTGTDPDGDVLTFSWAFVSRPAGSAAALSSTNTANATFVADVAGTYDLRLTVNDGHGGSDTDDIRVTASGQENRAPVANAGPDMGGVVGAIVTLNGVASSDPDGNPITYSWAFLSRPAGSAAVLGGVTTAAPAFTPDLIGVYEARLTVSDGQLSATDDVRVTVVAQNRSPVLTVSAPAAIFVGSQATITATASDPDNDPLTITFTLLDNPGGATLTANGSTATLSGGVGSYPIRVTVSDGITAEVKDVEIDINPNVAGDYDVTVFVDPTSCGESTQSEMGTLPVLQPSPGSVILDLPSASNDFETQVAGTLRGQDFFFQGSVRVSTDQGSTTLNGVVSGQITAGGVMDLNFSFPVFGSCVIIGTIDGTK
jgi:hypothetical protein